MDEDEQSAEEALQAVLIDAHGINAEGRHSAAVWPDTKKFSVSLGSVHDMVVLLKS